MITKKARAWVVRWSSIIDAPIEKPLIAIFDPRISAERIRWFVEQYYMVQTSNPREMVSYAKNSRSNPDKARFLANKEGVQCMGYISCGTNPLILATIVKDLVIKDEGNGNPEVSWVDIPMPEVPLR